jgi:hypothetical protein
MSWSGAPYLSAIFQQAMLNPIARGVTAVSGGFPTAYAGLTTDALYCSLFGNTGTPDKTAAVGLTGYGAASSAWVTGNEVTSSTQWPAGGVIIPTITWALDTASSSFCLHAAASTTNTVVTGNVTLANVYGCLVYDNTISGGTVSKQGMCFNYFGGSQSVTAGTFTVVWATVGATTAIFNISV